MNSRDVNVDGDVVFIVVVNVVAVVVVFSVDTKHFFPFKSSQPLLFRFFRSNFDFDSSSYEESGKMRGMLYSCCYGAVVIAAAAAAIIVVVLSLDLSPLSLKLERSNCLIYVFFL